MAESSTEFIEAVSKQYNYADLLYERGILHKTAKIVEGCVGNIGVEPSLKVAKYLGENGKIYFVDFERDDLKTHERDFLRKYRAKSDYGKPEFKWIFGAIEDQVDIIKNCDALLFHNYTPLDRRTYDGEDEGSTRRIINVFKKLVDTKPPHITLYLPNSKCPETVGRIFQSLGAKVELIDNICYADDLSNLERIMWRGMIVLAKC